MISYVKGKLFIKNDTNCTILPDGISIGILVNINSNLIESYSLEDEISLYVKTIVKENDISLFGFINNEQLSLFEHLLTVNGIGPKVAMNIISTINSETLISDIVSEKADNLSKVKGLGKKTAEKIVFTLKDKFKKIYQETNKTSSNDNIDLVIQSMLALGYDKKTSLNAVNITYKNELTIQQNIIMALNYIKNN